MSKEFRDFVLRGNVLDLAVAVVMGGAFGAIITSLVNDIIMPLVGVLMGGVDIASLSVVIGDAVIAYGKFLQAIVNFLLIALALFFVIKSINTLQKRLSKEKEIAPTAPATPSEDIVLLGEIRDLLKSR
ncbi:MAG: mechanosensitive ion channel protein MscL [Chloroflexi bacterium RBG_16_57_11]|nr:MAG: mechanosensitive ion channel protein MscL [Chloroflexi bacterium RBG_16_57_11]